MTDITLLDRLLADAVNFLILGCGFGLLATLIIAGIINGVPSIRKLVVPGRDAIDTAAEWVAKMRQYDRDPDRDYQMSDVDKATFATIVLGLSIRNGLVILALTLLIGQLATGGM